MYKFGGTYLDSDAAVVKSIPEVGLASNQPPCNWTRIFRWDGGCVLRFP